jgi:hypothetical protein
MVVTRDVWLVADGRAKRKAGVDVRTRLIAGWSEASSDFLLI